MSAPSGEISVLPQVLLLEQVLGEMAAGRLRIPAFQRPFVWRPEQMRSLFDSIERGYPVGSLLVWQTDEEIASLDEIAGIKIPRPAKRGAVTSYILDGHQRMSTLFGCLWRRPADGAEEENWKWRLFRELGAREDRIQHWKRQGGTSQPPVRYLPMGAVLKTMDFLAFARRLSDYYASRVRGVAGQGPEDPGDEARRLLEEAEEFAQRIKSYQIAVVNLLGGDLEHAVEAFSRLNTNGQTMSPDQMVSALIFQPGVDTLATRIGSIREDLGAVGYRQISPITVFRTVLAIAGENDVLATRWHALADKLKGTMEETAEATGAALLGAVTFLRQIGVPFARLVPYAHQVMLLAVFFHARPEPGAEQVEELRRWFWGTSWSGHYAGANSTDIKIALQDMRDYARGVRTSPWQARPARPFPERFDLRSARVRAYLLWELKEFSLRDTPDGKEVNAVSALAESDTEAYRQVVTKGNNISHPANRLIMPTGPRISVRRALATLTDEQRHRVLRSHGIPEEALTRLRANDDEGFIAARAEFLIAKEREWMKTLGIEPSSTASTDAEIDTE